MSGPPRSLPAGETVTVGCSPTVRNMLDCGDLPAQDVGTRRVCILPSDLDEFLAEGKHLTRARWIAGVQCAAPGLYSHLEQLGVQLVGRD